jgi:ketosteroid isomerase-like protein
MSEENLETLRRTAEHFKRTGAFGPVADYDPEVTFTVRGDVGGPETFIGHDGLLAVMASFSEVWAEIDPTITELVEGDDVAVAVINFALRSHAGVDLKIEEAWAYWFRNGKICRIEQHAGRDAALEAVGLSE